MDIRRFEGASMQEALRRCKAELGGEAVVLHTRSFRRGGVMGLGGRECVEITACAEAAQPTAPRRRRAPREESVPVERRARLLETVRAYQAEGAEGEPARCATATAPTAVNRPSLAEQLKLDVLERELRSIKGMVTGLVRRQQQDDLPDALAPLLDRLTAQDLDGALARELLAQVAARLPRLAEAQDRDLEDALEEALRERVQVAGGIALRPEGPTVVAFIGPTGVGKTTTIAKLAAQHALERRLRVGLITADTFRIAAVEQLRVYADYIGVPLHMALTPRDMARALDVFQDRDLVLIDTAGRSQRDDLKLNELAGHLEAARPHEIHLVVSATSQRLTALKIQERFERFAPQRLILTKLDEAETLGGLWEILVRPAPRLAYLTDGQEVPRDIRVATPGRIASLLSARPRAGRSQEPVPVPALEPSA